MNTHPALHLSLGYCYVNDDRMFNALFATWGLFANTGTFYVFPSRLPLHLAAVCINNHHYAAADIYHALWQPHPCARSVPT